MIPRVSVIMSVHNGERHLAAAIESILVQTFGDFEFIVIDDGSTDATARILAQYCKSDARICLHRFNENRGLSSALNFGIRLARGEYVARMDADDISLPIRLEKQVEFMNSYPDVDICGSWVALIGERQGEEWQHPLGHFSIYARMLFGSALAHPTVMMRASSISDARIFYDERVFYAQDYDMWSRALPGLKMANLGQVLLYYRIHTQSVGSKYRADQLRMHGAIYRRLFQTLQIYPSDQELTLHRCIATMQYQANLSFLYASYVWLKKISRANRRVCVIPRAILDAELRIWWLRVSSNVFFHPASIPFPFSSKLPLPWGKIRKFAYHLTCLLRFGIG